MKIQCDREVGLAVKSGHPRLHIGRELTSSSSLHGEIIPAAEFSCLFWDRDRLLQVPKPPSRLMAVDWADRAGHCDYAVAANI